MLIFNCVDIEKRKHPLIRYGKQGLFQGGTVANHGATFLGPLTQLKGRAIRFLFRTSPSPVSLVLFFGFIFIIIKSYFSLVRNIFIYIYFSRLPITDHLTYSPISLPTNSYSLSYSSWEIGLSSSPWQHSQSIPCNPPPRPCL